MKKNIVVLLTLMSLGVVSYAQSEIAAMRVAVGARGGAVLPYGIKYDPIQKVGGEGLLDAQYSVYWNCNSTNLGLMTGVTVGYQQTGLTQKELCYQRYKPTDCGKLFYSVLTKDVKETKQTLDIEIPVMLALVSEQGVFFNFGPRLAFPVWNNSKVEFSSSTVKANLVEEGVMVTDELITGKVADKSVKANVYSPVLTLKLGAELGYEFRLGSGDAVSLGAYLDWAAYSCYKGTANVDLVQVTAPSNQAIASLTYNSPSNQYAKQTGSVNIGVKVAYQFNLIK